MKLGFSQNFLSIKFDSLHSKFHKIKLRITYTSFTLADCNGKRRDFALACYHTGSQNARLSDRERLSRMTYALSHDCICQASYGLSMTRGKWKV